MKELYLYHVPRTGGFSNYRWFEMLSRQGYARLWNDSHSAFKSKEAITNKFKGLAKNKKNPNPNLQADQLSTITWLRHPVIHAASLYTYIYSHGNHPNSKLMRTISFSEFIRLKGSPGDYLKFFAPGDAKVETAIKNLETLDFIGFTEQLNKDMGLLMAQLKIPMKYNNARHNFSGKRIQPSLKDIEYLKERREADFIIANEFRSRRGLELYS